MFCMAGLGMSGDAQAARFVNNGNGTVTDTQTGLMWPDQDNGSPINWYNAKSYCEGYSGGGKSGWRMPTLHELRPLYESGAYGSVIKKTGAGYIWSSDAPGSACGGFVFLWGIWIWTKHSYDDDRGRALPVRSGN